MLRLRRLARGLRLRDLARLIDVSENDLSYIERGDLPLRGRVLHRLAEAYSTSAERLLFEHERWEKSRRSAIMTARDEARLLADTPEERGR